MIGYSGMSIGAIIGLYYVKMMKPRTTIIEKIIEFELGLLSLCIIKRMYDTSNTSSLLKTKNKILDKYEVLLHVITSVTFGNFMAIVCAYEE